MPLLDELSGDAPVGSPDLQRIQALPRRAAPVSPAAAEWLEKVTHYMTRALRRERTTPCRCRDLDPAGCLDRLRPIQAAALYEAPRAGGELGFIGTGHGKSGLNILLPMVFPGVRTALLLIPADLRAQFHQHDYPLWSQHFRVPILAGQAPPWDANTPVLHVLSYSELSQNTRSGYLSELKPDLIIADEGQKLKNPAGAAAGRVDRYLRENPLARLCVHSGSLTKRSMYDYAHLADHSLGVRSPVPRDERTLEAWAEVLDPDKEADGPGELRLLCAPGETVEAGFQRRLIETPGVLATQESAVDVPLYFARRVPPALPDAVKAEVLHTRQTDERPDGEILVDDMERARCLRQLACGFYYRWTFPRGEFVSVIERWFEVRKGWMKELRDELRYRAREHLDSPLLLTRAATRWHDGYTWHDEQGGVHTEPPHSRSGPLPVWASDCWPAWREVRDSVQPATETVWLSDWLAADAAAWALDAPGIVWYEYGAFGAKIAELAGLRLYGGGPEASEEILKESGRQSIVASIRAHGTGKNLQQWARALVSNPPADGGTWEQAVARMHRPGQRAARVDVSYYAHTRELADALEKAKRFADYIESTTGTAQKLCHGVWESRQT
jgi:hypothetical protein